MVGAVITWIVKLFAEAFLDMAVKLATAHRARVAEDRQMAKVVEEHLNTVSQVLSNKEMSDEEADRLIKESARRIILS